MLFRFIEVENVLKKPHPVNTCFLPLFSSDHFLLKKHLENGKRVC